MMSGHMTGCHTCANCEYRKKLHLSFAQILYGANCLRKRNQEFCANYLRKQNLHGANSLRKRCQTGPKVQSAYLEQILLGDDPSY
jgi:hypothetical protein